MFDLTAFIRRCQALVTVPDPVNGLRAALTEAISDPLALQRALPRSDADEVLLHACGKITMVLVQLTPNVLFPPHNHHMPALIGLFDGVETNLMFVPDGPRLVRTSETKLTAPFVNVMKPEAIHAVANHGARRSAALHVYCGDLIGQQRTIWHPATFERHPYSDERYFQLATSFDPDRPLLRPETPSVHGSYLNRG